MSTGGAAIKNGHSKPSPIPVDPIALKKQLAAGIMRDIATNGHNNGSTEVDTTANKAAKTGTGNDYSFLQNFFHSLRKVFKLIPLELVPFIHTLIIEQVPFFH